MATLKCISEEDLEALLQAEDLETAEVFTPTTSGSFIKMATYSKISTVCANTFSDSSGNTYTVSFTADSGDTSTGSTSLASGTLTIAKTLKSSVVTTGTLKITKTDGSSGLVGSVFTVTDGTNTYTFDMTSVSTLSKTVEAGTYTITESTVPTGYTGSSSTSATVTANSTTSITIINTIKSYTVTVKTTNCTASSSSISVTYDGSTTFTLTANSGYDLPDSLTYSGTCSNNYSSSTGKVTLTNIQSNVTVTAVAVAQETEETTAVLLYKMTYTDGSVEYYYSDNTIKDSSGNTTKELDIDLNSLLNVYSESWTDNTTLETITVYSAAPGKPTTSGDELEAYDSLGNNTTGTGEGFVANDTSLTTIDFSGLEWDSITSLWKSFSGCTSLTSVYNTTISGVKCLDMSNIEDTGKGATYSKNNYSRCQVFDKCTSLKDLYLYKFTPDLSSYGGSDLYFGDSPLTYDSAKYLMDNMVNSSEGVGSNEYYSSTIVFSSTTGDYLSACDLYECCVVNPVSIYIASYDGPNSGSSVVSNHVENYSWGLNSSYGFKKDGATWSVDGTTYYAYSGVSGDYDGLTPCGSASSNGCYKAQFSQSTSGVWNVSNEEWIFFGGVYLPLKSNFLSGNTAVKYLDMSGVTLVNDESTWQALHNTDSVSGDYDTSMDDMFNGCTSLTYLNACTWNTDSITSMARMFQGCSSLVTVHLSWYASDGTEWNTSKVTDMKYLFDGCSSLVTVDCPENGIDMSNTDDSETGSHTEMFRGCTSLKTIKLFGVPGDHDFYMDKCPLDAESAIFLMNNIGESEDGYVLFLSETTYNNLGGSNFTSTAESALANVISKGWGEVQFLDEDEEVVGYYPQ